MVYKNTNALPKNSISNKTIHSALIPRAESKRYIHYLKNPSRLIKIKKKLEVMSKTRVKKERIQKLKDHSCSNKMSDFKIGQNAGTQIDLTDRYQC